MTGDGNGKDAGELFRKAVGPVRPLKRSKAPPEAFTVPPGPKPIPAQRLKSEREALHQLHTDPWDIAPDVETGDELSFSAPGVQHAVLRRLRRGQYTIQAHLDLHGRTVPEARDLLATFLQHCRDHDLRCVRIVHGKGRGSAGGIPILKVKVNSWLRRRIDVLAFCSAPAQDGGTGVLYVLLRVMSPG